MIDPLPRRVVRCTSRLTLLLLTLRLFVATGITFASTVADQVELKATHEAGILLHQEARGRIDFQRVPDGTKATVMEVAKASRASCHR